MSNENYQAVYNAVFDSFQHAGMIAQQQAGITGDEHCRPSVLFRPQISLDGNQWRALYGANLHDGVAGFGDTPDLAMRDFDKNWKEQAIAQQEKGEGQ